MMSGSFTDRLAEKIIQMAPEFNVVFAYLFGSKAREKTHPLSDIDVAVFYNSSISANDRFQGHLKLIERLQRLLPADKILDLVLLNEAPISMQFRIVSHGKIIYCSDGLTLANFKEITWKMYFDYKPLEDLYVKTNLGLI